MNLAQLLTDSAARRPERPAVRLDDVTLTYAQLDAASARFAGLLAQRGAQPGDRVAIMLPNVPHFAVCYYGALRAGAIVVPMNVLLRRREIAYYLADSGAGLLFAWQDFTPEALAGAKDAGAECVTVTPGGLEELLAGSQPSAELRRGDEDTAVLLYTSGTTGQPKGAELTHTNLSRNARAAASLFAIGEDAVTLGALPLFHSFGQTCGMNATLGAGGMLTLLPRFDPGRALEVIQRDRVNVFLGVPTMYAAMLHHPERERFDVSTLRHCGSGGAAMPVALLREFDRVFGCKVLEGYGLSETSPVASFNHADRERKPGSIGTPIEGVQMRIVGEDGRELPPGEVGEIVIRGYNVMKGYWRRPQETAEAIDADGWFHSGDLGRVDQDGYFYVVDRKKDMIIRGGYNVYPREIEEVLHEHPAVREAAVVGIPDPELGEEVGAAVVLEPGASVTAQELSEHVRAQLAAYKYPRRVWFVQELPKGPTGKILKREIHPPTER
ncbi:MAG TPA: long-chain fatty acid--CoA ligase [Solirubrobacteraceae bacterium]|nr:long-chain fatty acid--CoA ligase [Solirubrobacteraceae bacterium]